MHSKREPLATREGWAELRPLIARRRELGIRATDMAAALDLSGGALDRWEVGVTRLTPERIARYAAALNRLASLVGARHDAA